MGPRPKGGAGDFIGNGFKVGRAWAGVGTRRLQDLDMGEEVVGQLILGHATCHRSLEQGTKRRVVSHAQEIAVDNQKLDHGRRAGALVAIDEAMVLSDAQTQANCQSEDIALALVVKKLLRPYNRALDQTFVANTFGPTEAADLIDLNF